MNRSLPFPPSSLTLADVALPERYMAQVSRTLFTLLCLLAMTSTGLAQPLDPVPPANGLPIEKRLIQAANRLRQPSPPPQGGFWVVEDQPAKTGPTIVRFYTDQLRLLQTDTLHNVRLDIRRRALVDRLNERLLDLLPTSPADRLVTNRPTQ